MGRYPSLRVPDDEESALVCEVRAASSHTHGLTPGPRVRRHMNLEARTIEHKNPRGSADQMIEPATIIAELRDAPLHGALEAVVGQIRHRRVGVRLGQSCLWVYKVMLILFNRGLLSVIKCYAEENLFAHCCSVSPPIAHSQHFL